ncbi:MAG: tRNA lysidine(34) synthetase TilS, partial [Acidobacteriaceae bacterium]
DRLVPNRIRTDTEPPLPAACVRAWKPGDRVTMAHSRGPKKVKEILERMKMRGEERARWPVIVWQGQIVWMRGVRLSAAENSGGSEMQIRIEELPLQ